MGQIHFAVDVQLTNKVSAVYVCVVVTVISTNFTSLLLCRQYLTKQCFEAHNVDVRWRMSIL